MTDFGIKLPTTTEAYSTVLSTIAGKLIETIADLNGEDDASQLFKLKQEFLLLEEVMQEMETMRI